MAVVRQATTNRVLFQGPDVDAKAHVERNFPRVHIEPGNFYGDEGAPSDVHVELDDGSKHEYRNGEWVDYKRKDD